MSSEPVITITKSHDEIDINDYGDYDDNLPVMKVLYSVDGKIHRPSCDGPAVYVGMFCSNNRTGNVDRDTAGGVTTLSGFKMNLSRVYYYHDGKKHRSSSEGPAEIWYSWGDKISKEIYRENGKKHRPVNEGPAMIEYSYYDSDMKEMEEYYEHGKLLRVVCYDKDGNVIESYSDDESDDEFDDDSYDENQNDIED